MAKKIFSNTTPINPMDMNVLQDPQWVNSADYPLGTNNRDLDPGIYFVPPINVTKNLVGFPNDADVYLDGVGNLSDPWGGRVFATTQEQLTSNNYTVTPGFIALWVTQGSIISTTGEVVTWNSQFVQILNNTTSYIYSDNFGIIHVGTSLPSRNTPRVGLAKIVFTNTSVFDIIDIRPNNKVGARDDLQLYLVNTGIKTDNYQAINNDRVLCDSTTNSFVITLPVNPQDNDRVGLVDVSGSFAANPVVLTSPLIETSPGVFVPSQNIGGQSDSWQFEVPRTNVSLVFSAARNDWLFEETPNDACAGIKGSFLRCGGAVPGITTEETCTTPNSWDATRLLCIRPPSVAVYSDGTDTNFYLEYNSQRCGAVFSSPPGISFSAPLVPFFLSVNLIGGMLTNTPDLPPPSNIVQYQIYNTDYENITAALYSKLEGNHVVLGSSENLSVIVIAVGG